MKHTSLIKRNMYFIPILENSLLLYLANSTSCILSELFFIYCNCLRISVSYPRVN